LCPIIRKYNLETIISYSVFLFISIIINAQIDNQISIGLGVNGGLTYSNILQKNDLHGNYDFEPGFNSGLSVELELKSNISIETNICYYQNGYNFNIRDTLRIPDFKLLKSYIGFENRIRQDYLNNSWLVGYSIGNKIEFSI